MTTALLFRFPLPGPWGKELTEASHELTRDIANEHGLACEICLEDRETDHAGRIHLFADAAAAERYRAQLSCHYSISRYVVTAENDKDAVFCDTANAFSVNTELSVLTMAGAAMARAALGDADASKSTSAATAPIPS
jgi:Putative mono-oxygenase ydhR